MRGSEAPISSLPSSIPSPRRLLLSWTSRTSGGNPASSGGSLLTSSLWGATGTPTHGILPSPPVHQGRYPDPDPCMPEEVRFCPRYGHRDYRRGTESHSRSCFRDTEGNRDELWNCLTPSRKPWAGNPSPLRLRQRRRWKLQRRQNQWQTRSSSGMYT